MLDLGSGIGYSADFFYRKGLRIVAVDGLSDNVKMALYPTVCHDLTKGPVFTSVGWCIVRRSLNISMNASLKTSF